MKNKVCKSGKYLLLLFLISPFFTPTVNAQYGYSSASMGMGKMLVNTQALPTPKQVVVEEFFNYHKHDLPSPINNEPIALDISRYNAVDGSTILQIGISTGFVEDKNDIPPVNVCLVIDRSGSMAGDRLIKAKEAAIEFVKRLREKDVLSLVLFDDKIDVLIPAQHVSNKKKLIQLINTIEVRGSTDLHGGLIKGYDEVLKNYKLDQNNKVIMLTDAIANTGVVDPIQIIKGSNSYKKEYKIDITMVGVGVDFNVDLSRQISGNNRSSIFFINDAEDIKKVFIDEIESLLSPIANEVSLAIDISDEYEIEKCFGYSPRLANNQLFFDLENMNSGLTQVILIKLKAKSGKPIRNGKITAKINYFDLSKKETTSKSIHKDIIEQKFDNEKDIQKNYYIARMAQCICDIALLNEQNNLNEAKYRSKFILESTLIYYPLLKDTDIKRVYDILKKYDTILRKDDLEDVSAEKNLNKQKLSFPY